MKTTILRLDPLDDVLSIQDKMGWGKSSRILLVWPEHSKAHMLTRQLDLVLLLRHSASIGAQLALVTSDPLVREHARALGIPVFGKLRQAQHSRWRSVSNEQALNPSRQGSAARRDLRSLGLGLSRPVDLSWSQQSGVRLASLLLVIAALLLMAGSILPTTRISLQPNIQTQEITIPVRADPKIQRINLSGVLPGTWLRLTVEGRDSLPSSGNLRLPYKAAGGQAVFTNITTDVQTIPAGTIVRTISEPPQRYATTRNGSVPAGAGKSVSLPILALQPGLQGNLQAGKLGAIEGPLGLNLTVTNPQLLSGGSEQTLPAPVQTDRYQLFEKLETALRQSAMQEMQSQLEPGDLLLGSSLTMAQVLEETYLPADDTPAETLQLSLRLEYQALLVAAASQQELATAVLDASLPKGYTTDMDSLQVKQLGLLPDNAWTMYAHRVVWAQIDPTQAAAMVVGMTPTQAIQRLQEAYPLSSAPVVQITPAWWPRLSLLPARIEIVITTITSKEGFQDGQNHRN